MKNSLSRQELNVSLFVLTGDAGGPKTSAGCHGELIRYNVHRIAPVEKPPRSCWVALTNPRNTEIRGERMNRAQRHQFCLHGVVAKKSSR